MGFGKSSFGESGFGKSGGHRSNVESGIHLLSGFCCELVYLCVLSQLVSVVSNYCFLHYRDLLPPTNDNIMMGAQFENIASMLGIDF